MRNIKTFEQFINWKQIEAHNAVTAEDSEQHNEEINNEDCESGTESTAKKNETNDTNEISSNNEDL